MKTSIFFASAMLFSFFTFAQQSTVRSNNSGKAGLESSASKVAGQASAQSTTEAGVHANPQPTVQAASATTHQTRGEIRSESASTVRTAKSDARETVRQSTTATSALSSDVQQLNESSSIKVEGKNASAAHVSGGHNNKIGAVTSINGDNNTSATATVNQPVETPKPVVTKPVGTKAARVRTNGSAALNSNIGAGSLNMSGFTKTGLNVGL